MRMDDSTMCAWRRHCPSGTGGGLSYWSVFGCGGCLNSNWALDMSGPKLNWACIWAWALMVYISILEVGLGVQINWAWAQFLWFYKNAPSLRLVDRPFFAFDFCWPRWSSFILSLTFSFLLLFFYFFSFHSSLLTAARSFLSCSSLILFFPFQAVFFFFLFLVLLFFFFFDFSIFFYLSLCFLARILLCLFPIFHSFPLISFLISCSLLFLFHFHLFFDLISFSSQYRGMRDATMRLRGAAWPALNCKAARQIGSQAREQLGGGLGDVICFAGMGNLGHRHRSGVVAVTMAGQCNGLCSLLFFFFSFVLLCPWCFDLGSGHGFGV